MDRQIQTKVEAHDERRRVDKLLVYFRELLEILPENPEPESDEGIEREQLLARIEGLELRKNECDAWINPARAAREPTPPIIRAVTEKPAASIVVLDDHEVVRRGVVSLLESRAGWKVVAEAQDGDSACQVVKDLQPDILITDQVHPGLSGIEVTRWVTQNVPGVRVLLLTMHASKQFVREVLEAGGRGYVMKSDAGKDLLRAIDTLLEDKMFFTQPISDILLDGFLEKPRPNMLSKRETDILALLARGKSNKEVSTQLNISLRTAETHRANIMNKLQLDSVQDLVRYAVKNKLVDV